MTNEDCAQQPALAAAAYDNRRPVVFMHIPKTAGTTFGQMLQSVLVADNVLRGFDRALFGGFTAFATMSQAERANIYLDRRWYPGMRRSPWRIWR